MVEPPPAAAEEDGAPGRDPQRSPSTTSDADGTLTPHHFSVLARDGTVLAMSGDVAGIPVSAFLGTNGRRWVDSSSIATFDRALTAVFETRRPQAFEWLAAASGRRYASRLVPYWDGAQSMQAILMSDDIGARESERAAREEKEQLLEALVQGAFEGLQVSVDGTILVANDALARMLRVPLEQVIGQSGFGFCHPDDRARARALAQARSEAPYEVTGLRPDGTTFPCEIIGRQITYRGRAARLTGFRDLTERRRAERERQELQERIGQAQKLESLGTLAGGIAHDFNNVLMAVLGNAELALRGTKADSATTSHLRTVRAAAMRGRELTRQLLNYAAQGPLTREAVDLNELVRDTVALLSASINKKARLRLELMPDPAVVLGDPGQIRQLVMNWVINASDALGDRPGHITVETGREPVPTDSLLVEPSTSTLTGRPAVLLRVTDDGVGLDAATKQRIFEPFYSTKGPGRGLGLPSVLNVVRGHDGAIQVESEVGRGTTFAVWLPAHDGPSETSVVNVEAASRPSAARGLALVADDEPVLRELARELLAGMGFDTVSAKNGREALQVFEREQERLTLLLLDLTMPELGGADVVRRLRADGANVPILCASGYSADRLATLFVHDPRTRFLSKPYSVAELEASVQALLRG